jgi:hypothetical protein
MLNQELALLFLQLNMALSKFNMVTICLTNKFDGEQFIHTIRMLKIFDMKNALFTCCMKITQQYLGWGIQKRGNIRFFYRIFPIVNFFLKLGMKKHKFPLPKECRKLNCLICR